LCHGEVRPVLQPQPAGVLELGAGGELGTADGVHRFAELGSQVVTVEGHLRVRQMLGDSADEGRTHVGAGVGNLLRVAAVGGQIGGEALDGLGGASLGGEQDPAGIHVGEDADVVLTLARGGELVMFSV
jgi:hypothetical protein